MLSGQQKRRADYLAQKYCIDGTRVHGVEHLYAYDLSNGSLVCQCSGSQNRVSIPSSLAGAGRDPLRKIIVVHSHPRSGSFSTIDLSTLVNNPGFHELQAVGVDQTVFRCRIKAPTNAQQLAKVYIIRMDSAYLRVLNSYRSLTIPEAAFLALESAHIKSTAIAKLNVMEYDVGMPSKRHDDVTVNFRSLFDDFAVKVYHQIIDASW